MHVSGYKLLVKEIRTHGIWVSERDLHARLPSIGMIEKEEAKNATSQSEAAPARRALQKGTVSHILQQTMSTLTTSAIKGIDKAAQKIDGSGLRVAIVHARWNKVIIDALIAGTIAKLRESGVKDSNIIVESVPGSYELPLAASRFVARRISSHFLLTTSRIISGSQVQNASNVGDLLGGSGSPQERGGASTNQPFDAVIAIGVLIKGATMHFEYICDSVSQGLMRVQLDTGVPVIFGVLTALTDDQALERAGLGRGDDKGHNHGEDWGLAAVEMASHTRRWAQGNFAQ